MGSVKPLINSLRKSSAAIHIFQKMYLLRVGIDNVLSSGSSGNRSRSLRLPERYIECGK